MHRYLGLKPGVRNVGILLFIFLFCPGPGFRVCGQHCSERGRVRLFRIFRLHALPGRGREGRRRKGELFNWVDGVGVLLILCMALLA
ncbi:hypothetical protein K402DRAFT_122391 [Aulographum hederae CBS 113979]|uniref:Uncharacterized protein n=1 Tax=Aulographum hederae CBS 113979 TaxID=1176131 RepID=A0A6G1GW43_9PEZI|nr:hypothetical protein K402DRAFT_122391 [Aulographum hederae CBS 113979]